MKKFLAILNCLLPTVLIGETITIINSTQGPVVAFLQSKKEDNFVNYAGPRHIATCSKETISYNGTNEKPESLYINYSFCGNGRCETKAKNFSELNFKHAYFSISLDTSGELSVASSDKAPTQICEKPKI